MHQSLQACLCNGEVLTVLVEGMERCLGQCKPLAGKGGIVFASVLCTFLTINSIELESALRNGLQDQKFAVEKVVPWPAFLCLCSEALCLLGGL